MSLAYASEHPKQPTVTSGIAMAYFKARNVKLLFVVRPAATIIVSGLPTQRRPPALARQKRKMTQRDAPPSCREPL